MPTQIGDFINTFLNMAQLQQNQERIQQAHTDAAVNGVNLFASLARQTANPAQQTALVERFAQLGVASKDQLLSILQNITPTTDALKAGEIQRGIGVQEKAGTGDQLASDTAQTNLTGEDVGQSGVAHFLNSTIGMAQPNQDLANAFATRETSGLTPGAFAVDAATGRLPASEITQAAGVKAGTRLSAGENANMQLGFANVRERAAADTMQNALGQAELNFKGASTKVANLSSISNLLDTKAGILKNLSSAKDMQPAVAKSFIGALNSINQTLQMLGQPNEGQIPLDPETVITPGFISGILRRFGAKP